MYFYVYVFLWVGGGGLTSDSPLSAATGVCVKQLVNRNWLIFSFLHAVLVSIFKSEEKCQYMLSFRFLHAVAWVATVSKRILSCGCESKPMGPFWGRCTTHFRTYFSGDWAVHRGYGLWLLTHGRVLQDPGEQGGGTDHRQLPLRGSGTELHFLSSELHIGHGSKPMGSHFGVFGEFTHVRTYFGGIESDVHWGYGVFTHGHIGKTLLGVCFCLEATLSGWISGKPT